MDGRDGIPGEPGLDGVPGLCLIFRPFKQIQLDHCLYKISVDFPGWKLLGKHFFSENWLQLWVFKAKKNAFVHQNQLIWIWPREKMSNEFLSTLIHNLFLIPSEFGVTYPQKTKTIFVISSATNRNFQDEPVPMEFRERMAETEHQVKNVQIQNLCSYFRPKQKKEKENRSK